MLEVKGWENGKFTVKHQQTENITRINDTFAEMFPMWVSRILITAATKEWALTSAQAATGFAVSIIMSPAEAGIEKTVSPNETPDHRPGVVIQIYHNFGYGLKEQMLTRIGQCIMTCPTTAAFNAMEAPRVKKLKIGRSLSFFGDGFQKKDDLDGRKIWKIPVMEGEFVVDEVFTVTKGVAGGNFLILALDQASGLTAAESAVHAIRQVDGVVLTFPGGICRAGSKIGSMKYKLPASTNHLYCPSIQSAVTNTAIPANVSSVYEIVINGLNLESVQTAIGRGVTAAAAVPGVQEITAANYGGKLGPHKAILKEILNLE
jgi:formylmethanofuran--tetrahydromethanopterin N-formyltransferase